MQNVRRLFEYFEPSHYELELSLEREERLFSGTVIISGHKTSDTAPIMLHAKDLDVASVVLDNSSVPFSQDADELTVTAELPVGDYSLIIEFGGHISDPMHGLYPCYFSLGDEKHELLMTQFESHHAREVFPCVDEPEAKATFALTLITESDVQVLSNMPQIEQSTVGDNLKTCFETTPRMSSYLLAFVVGELQKKSTTSKHGVEVNVWSTKAQTLSSLDFALDIATRAVDFFDDYFGVPYPLPKTDHVAVPDFSAGAMENWGLITYREHCLLAEENAAQDTKEYVASVIAHELSHQWFGDLVTMRWWNNLWLNESFASIMEYVCIDALESEWHVWDDITMQEGIQALRKDAADGVQAVQTEVHHPDEINSLFDGAIVYAKGARLMRMMLEYVGKDAFRKGLQAYFKEHAYKNTEADDLWGAMSVASGKDVTALMHAWISQPGYPLVTIGENTLKQERFFIGEHAPSDTIWPIPLFSNDSVIPELMSTSFVETTVPKGTILNSGDRAHFITHYGVERLAALREQIAKNEISAVDRLRLLHEQSLLIEAESLGAGEIIPLLLTYRTSTEEPVWAMVSNVARSLRGFVEADSDAASCLGKFYTKLVRVPFDRLGWYVINGESTSDAQLRADVLNLVVHSHEKELTADAETIFASTSLEEIDANIRVSVLRAVLDRQTDDTLFDKLFAQYAAVSSPEIKNDLMYSLTGVSTEHAQKVMLSALKDSSIVRPQDLKLWMMLLLHTPKNRYTSWRWLVDNWDWITTTFGSDMFYERFIQYGGNYLATRKELEEFQEFFGALRDIPSITRTISISEKQISARVSLLEHQSANFIAALERSF